MNEDPTLEDVIAALNEIALAMEDADDRTLFSLSGMYASAYAYKLSLMAKEAPRADR